VDIKRKGSQPSNKGPAQWFTGEAHIERMNQATAPARASVSSVTFQPGARTAWHSHPLGQTLVVTDGRGRVQSWDGPVEEIQSGDVVWAPPSEKHWHGATGTTGMTHISILEQLDGKSADWMEHVSDEQFHAGSKKDS
jgi:quercetin dioxygenase-like cupin family protein